MICYACTSLIFLSTIEIINCKIVKSTNIIYSSSPLMFIYSQYLLLKGVVDREEVSYPGIIIIGKIMFGC